MTTFQSTPINCLLVSQGPNSEKVSSALMENRPRSLLSWVPEPPTRDSAATDSALASHNSLLSSVFLPTLRPKLQAPEPPVELHQREPPVELHQRDLHSLIHSGGGSLRNTTCKKGLSYFVSAELVRAWDS